MQGHGVFHMNRGRSSIHAAWSGCVGCPGRVGECAFQVLREASECALALDGLGSAVLEETLDAPVVLLEQLGRREVGEALVKHARLGPAGDGWVGGGAE